MNIRDLSLLERLPASLDELIEACKPGGTVSTKCPHLSADATRKAMALKGAVLKLRPALDAAGPPPTFLKPNEPLYMRIGQPEIREIARLLGHYGAHEQDFYALTKKLAGEVGNERVSDAMRELTWTDPQQCWVRLRPEVIQVCRLWIGPRPGDEDLERWWADKGGAPRPRSPGDPRSTAKAEAEARKPAARKKPVKKPRKKAPAPKNRSRRKEAG
jgi:hypothetical protein